LAKTAKATGSKLFLDTSGAALKAALVHGVYMMKPNLRELSILSGVQSLQHDEVVKAARNLILEGKAEVIVVSMSSAGAVLVTREMDLHIGSPDVEQRSTVGAGDSMVSGMVWALQQNKSLQEMLCWGVACGSAATMNTGTKLFRRADAEKLFASIQEKVLI
jgi:6-phosphofructokinase 2